jgi:hypothetical protein
MHPIMSGCRVLALSVGIIIAGVDGALACGSGKLLVEDKFETLDPAWGFDKTSPGRSNGPGGLIYKFNPADNIDLLNQAGLYDNYEVCAVFATEVPANAGAWVAVNFWGNDKNNVYEADIYPTFGTFGVVRYQNKKSLTPVTTTDSDTINKGTSVTNEISVTVNGNKATIAINGKKAIDFTGQPPEGGSLFGLNIGSAKDDTGPSTITVKDIQLREAGPASKP